MDKLFGLAQNLWQPRLDGSFSDKVVYEFTGWILIVFSVTISAKVFIGSPLHCWVPAHFLRGWEQYSDDICFVQGTYYLPTESTLPEDLVEEGVKINYYQWVPFVLAMMGCLCSAPRVVWKTINRISGVSIRAIIATASKVERVHKEEQGDLLLGLVTQDFWDRAQFQKFCFDRKHTFCYNLVTFGLGKRLVVGYIVVKVLYVLNILLQLSVIQFFLGTDNPFWGFRFLKDILEGNGWSQTGHFPRMTMCRFYTKHLSVVHQHTLQCTLPTNLWNEKIFIFLWWWMAMVGLLSICSFLYWAFLSFYSTANVNFIKGLIYPWVSDEKDTQFEKFIEEVLTLDGLLCLRLMESNVGAVITSEIAIRLWLKFQAEEEELRKKHPDVWTTALRDPGPLPPKMPPLY